MDKRAQIKADIDLINEAIRVERHVLSTEHLLPDDRKQRQLGIQHNIERLRELARRLAELGPEASA